MPSPEQVNRYQAATLWAADGTYTASGQPKRGTPVEIRVRWDDTRKEMLDKDGNTITVDASAVVDRDIPVHSLMRLGELAEWLGTGSSLADEELREVMMFNKVPDIRNRFAFREVGMMRWRNDG